MKTHSLIRLLGLVLVVATSACTTVPPTPSNPESYRQTKVDGPGVKSYLVHGKAEKPRNLPKSRIGNPDSYKVFGKRYQVMDTASGFREQGIASWYGSKFHGRKTSSGETYNMYNMTAAHKHLPLPTFVRVTNLNNGKRLVVKVTDRGPFVDDRIIDLSYGAAARLGVLATGTAPVEIVAISTHRETPLIATTQESRTNPETEVINAAKPTQSVTPAEADVIVLASGRTTAKGTPSAGVPVGYRKVDTLDDPIYGVQGQVIAAPATTTAAATSIVTYESVAASGTVIQLGAFSDRRNAEAMQRKVNQAISDEAAIISVDQQRQLHKVQIGPLPAQVPIDDILQRLRLAGIDRYSLFEL